MVLRKISFKFDNSATFNERRYVSRARTIVRNWNIVKPILIFGTIYKIEKCQNLKEKNLTFWDKEVEIFKIKQSETSQKFEIKQ